MKNPSRASINLGNETYSRGFNDGLNGRPATIKKSHRHLHRYNKGYALGAAEQQRTMHAAVNIDNEGVMQSFIKHADAIQREDVKKKPKGLLSRFVAWLRG